LPIGADILLMITSASDELLRCVLGVTLNDLELQNRVFLVFFAISGCDTHIKSELRRNGWRYSRSGQPAYKILA